MKDSFAPLQRTFDEQNADIAMVNLSLSSYGFMLSLTELRKSSYLLQTTKRDYQFVVVDKIGGDLSRLDSAFYRLGSKKNFSEFAAYINELKSESLNDIDNGGLHIRDLNATANDNSLECGPKGVD
jgi:hypothetical protein